MPIESVEDIRKKFPHPPNTNSTHKNNLSQLEKLGLLVTQRVGTMGFFFTILTWTILWLGWNILAPKNLRFDPFPAFVLWLFISNLIQIHLMPLIMVGQNIQGRHQELQTEHDYQTDKKSEMEIETILLRLEEQNKLIQEMSQKLERLAKRN